MVNRTANSLLTKRRKISFGPAVADESPPEWFFCFAHVWILLVFSSTTGGKPAGDIQKINELFARFGRALVRIDHFCPVCLSDPTMKVGTSCSRENGLKVSSISRSLPLGRNGRPCRGPKRRRTYKSLVKVEGLARGVPKG
jgi:hypothetical protein